MNLKPLIASLSFFVAAAAAQAQEIWPDAAALPEASYPHTATRQIALGKGVTITAKFELTEKGNGGLTIPGYGVRVYDAERDGVTFRGYLLSCEWRDTNGDGFLDLVVSGMAQFWSEKTNRLEVEKPIRAVLQYAPDKKAFVLMQSSPEIFTWTNRRTASGRPSDGKNNACRRVGRFG